MGVSVIPCKNIALEELRARLEEIAAETSSPPLLTDPLVVLIGENNNVIGIGFVTDVGLATVDLVLPAAILAALGIPLGDVEQTVSQCSVCSIFVFDLATPAAVGTVSAKGNAQILQTNDIADNIIFVLQFLDIIGLPVNIPIIVS